MTQVEMEIVQGEDWTTDVVWTDNYDEAVAVVHPCRMDIKDSSGATLHSLVSNPDIPDGDIPDISISQNLGLLQLHIEDTVSVNFIPGQYNYDLFATVDGGAFGGLQTRFLFGGTFNVIKRITEL